MTLTQDTYDAFMLDYAAGNQPAALSLAGDLHILLSDDAASVGDIWHLVANEFDRGDEDAAQPRDLKAACGYLIDGLRDIRWKRGISGAHYAKAEPKGGQFMKLMPGKSVPTHGHKKLEVTVVLEGEFSDGIGIYRPGDIVFGVPGMRHKPAAHGDKPCVCYVAKS